MAYDEMIQVRLDPTDVAILEILQVDGRISVSELGRKVGLSQPAASERIKRLEERGIVAGYAARINPSAVGLNMMAIIRLRTTHEFIQPCLKQFAAMPQVIEVLRLTGEDCFLLKVIVLSSGDLETIVDSIAKFGSVTTSLVLRSEPVKSIGRALLRPGIAATRGDKAGEKTRFNGDRQKKTPAPSP